MYPSFEKPLPQGGGFQTFLTKHCGPCLLSSIIQESVRLPFSLPPSLPFFLRPLLSLSFRWLWSIDMHSGLSSHSLKVFSPIVWLLVHDVMAFRSQPISAFFFGFPTHSCSCLSSSSFGQVLSLHLLGCSSFKLYKLSSSRLLSLLENYFY